jgi:hypothetical protein
VPLIFAGPDSPPDYVEIFNRYWQQAAEQIDKLENRLGSVTRVLHETLIIDGSEGLRLLEKLSPQSYEIARQKCKDGTGLQCIEDRELLEEVMDWERCLISGLISHKVTRQIFDFYNDASKKRFQHLAKAIDENVKDGDVALLFIREGHLVQFPSDMDVFSVSPPALDELHRWAREQAARREQKEQ